MLADREVRRDEDMFELHVLCRSSRTCAARAADLRLHAAAAADLRQDFLWRLVFEILPRAAY